jgi:hypothetical protein
MKKIGFLSVDHWSRSPGSQTRTAADALQQSVEPAVAAEGLAADGVGRVVSGRVGLEPTTDGS